MAAKENYEEKLAPSLKRVYPVLDALLSRLKPILGRFEDKCGVRFESCPTLVCDTFRSGDNVKCVYMCTCM